MSCPINNMTFAGDQLAVFQGASEAAISEFIRFERATRKNSQLATARRVAMKTGRRRRLPDRLRIDPDMRPPRVRQLPDRRPILIATKATLFMGQDTGVHPSVHVKSIRVPSE